MTDTTTQLDRTFGKVGYARESHQSSLLLSLFHTPAPANLPWDGSHGLSAWGMDGNDQWGCCGAAATDHGNMAKAGDAALLNTLGNPLYAGTLPTYWAYGVAQGETGQPPNPPSEPDYGVENNTWCAFLYAHGLIDGYGEVPLDDLRAYAVQFNGLLLACQLSSNAQQQFVEGTAWGQPGDSPNPALGHDVWLIQLNQDGSGAVITWGRIQQVTAAFLKDYGTDAWAFVDKDDPAVDHAALDAALQALNGNVRPAGPPPVPQPVPALPTNPLDAAVAEIEKILADLEASIGRRAPWEVLATLVRSRGSEIAGWVEKLL